MYWVHATTWMINSSDIEFIENKINVLGEVLMPREWYSLLYLYSIFLSEHSTQSNRTALLSFKSSLSGCHTMTQRAIWSAFWGILVYFGFAKFSNCLGPIDDWHQFTCIVCTVVLVDLYADAKFNPGVHSSNITLEISDLRDIEPSECWGFRNAAWIMMDPYVALLAHIGPGLGKSLPPGDLRPSMPPLCATER
jgi:hypothetical protein